MSLPLQVAEWEDVKHFFPEGWTPEEITDMATAMDDADPLDELLEKVEAHESAWMDDYADRGGDPDGSW